MNRIVVRNRHERDDRSLGPNDGRSIFEYRVAKLLLPKVLHTKLIRGE